MIGKGSIDLLLQQIDAEVNTIETGIEMGIGIERSLKVVGVGLLIVTVIVVAIIAVIVVAIVVIVVVAVIAATQFEEMNMIVARKRR